MTPFALWLFLSKQSPPDEIHCRTAGWTVRPNNVIRQSVHCGASISAVEYQALIADGSTGAWALA
jgi:hypothetical protein